MKTCTKCGEQKPFSEFGVSRTGRHGPVYRPSCRSCQSAANKAWRRENEAKLRAYDKARASEIRRQSCLTWQRENREKLAAARRKKYAANPAKIRAQVAARRAALKKATPPWLDVSSCEWAYVAAAMFSASYQEPYEVDHIVPISGKNVCGLHVPWNLRPCRSSENKSKSNKFVYG